MKKLLSLFLVLVMLLSLAGCVTTVADPGEGSEFDDILGTIEYAEEDLYTEMEETQGDPDAIDRGTASESQEEPSDEIVEFFSEGFEPDPTDTAPTETNENELPMDPIVPEESTTPAVEPLLDEFGTYTSMEDVALYLYLYHKLPGNFITKKEAQALGWPGGYLEPYAPGKCIGGDRFGNYEGLLPTNHKYTECDIDTLGAKSRGAKRIVFSNDYSLIYYTDNHYESFTLVYGEE